jgi:hypothetical protein
MSELDYISRIPRRIEFDDGIRRAFTPALIQGCVGWWRADMGITLNGSKIVQWSDSSGAGNHLTQGTDALRPTLNAGIVNGQPVASFSDASGTYLQSLAAGLAPGQVTMIGALRRTADQTIQFIGGRGNTGFDGYYLGTTGTDSLRSDFGNGAAAINPTGAAGSWPLNGWIVAASVFDNVNGTLYSNGVLRQQLALAGPLTYTQSPSTTFYLGQLTGLIASRGLTGDIAECVVFNRGLQLAEIIRITKYMGSRYAIAVSG